MKVNIPVLEQMLSPPVHTRNHAASGSEEGCFELALLEISAALSAENAESDAPIDTDNIADETGEGSAGPMEDTREAPVSDLPAEELFPESSLEWLFLVGAAGIPEGADGGIPMGEVDGEMAESPEGRLFSVEGGEAVAEEGVSGGSIIPGAEQTAAFEAPENAGEGVPAESNVADNSEAVLDESQSMDRGDHDGKVGRQVSDDPAVTAGKEGSMLSEEPSIVAEGDHDGEVERPASETDGVLRESRTDADRSPDAAQRSVSPKPEQDSELGFLRFPMDLPGNKGVTPTMVEVSQQSFERMRAQVVDQVFGRLAYFSESDSVPAEMRLTLNPPSLGELVIRVFSYQGKMTAEIITEMGRVKDMLENGMGEIKQRLQQVNLTLEKIDVFCHEQDPEKDMSYRWGSPHGKSLAGRGGSRIGIVEEAVPEIWSVPVEGVSLELWA